MSEPIIVIHENCESQLYYGDCFKLDLPHKQANLVLADPPFGVEWLLDFDFNELWELYSNVLTPTGIAIIDCIQPYSSLLIASKVAMYRHSRIWVRDIFASARYTAKDQPMLNHLEYVVFSAGRFSSNAKNKCTYHPELLDCDIFPGEYPRSVFFHPIVKGDRAHAGQKPIGLLRWLIRTYSSPGDTVLDHVMGSGTTGIAANLEGRNFIGVEIEKNVFNSAVQNIRRLSLDERESLF